MNDKAIIFGKGFIGNRLREELNCAITGKRINSYADAEKEIKRFSPGIIINCIGHTGRNVDDCELDKDKSLIGNSFVPIILAEAALRYKIRLVHISSGCIYEFDYEKQRPVSENDEPDFFRLFYSRTKIYSEQALRILAKKYPVLIARIRIPLDNRPNNRNILTKLISFKNVIDVPNSVTYLPDFIRALKHLLRIKASGIYNIVNKGGLRYPRLLEVYKKYAPGFEYNVVPYKKFNLIRTNLILSVKKLEDTGFKMRSINEVLEECVKNYLKY